MPGWGVMLQAASLVNSPTTLAATTRGFYGAAASGRFDERCSAAETVVGA